MADSAQLHAIVVDLETEGRGVGDLQFVQDVVFKVEELVAAETDQVVVEFEARVETGDPAGMAGLCDDTHSGEVLEGAIDRCARDSRNSNFDGVKYLICRRVIVELEDRFEDDPALHCATLAALAAEPPEELDAFCPCRLVQAAAPLNSVALR